MNCTNPSCETIISVPEGAMQVICPNCNTWHFPETSQESASFDMSTGSDDYGMPPSMPDSNPGSAPNMKEAIVQPLTPDFAGIPAAASNFQEPVVAPPVQQSPYVNVNSFDQQVPSNHDGMNANQEAQTGCLITDTGVRLSLQAGRNIIGRQGADLVIDDRTVSRRHCVIDVEYGNSGNEFTIYDYGHLEGQSSTNGVFVVGRTMRLQDYERIPIRNGSSFRVGKVQLTLQVT